jgi:SAM-dependent methyltransferase
MGRIENKASTRKLLENFLNVFWLRPETALWRTIDVLAMDAFAFGAPSLDLGCGDGIFSFIRAGGEFEESFDIFQSVGEIEKYFDNVDIYNHFDANKVCPIVTKAPRYKINIALDHKEALLKKAATIGFYDKMVCHDANHKLPFEGNTFKTIFSNIIYWLDNPVDVFKEINRILMPNGRALVMLPNDSLKEYSFYYRLYVKTGDNRWKWLEKIDRGRLSDNIKHTNDDKTWREIFAESSLEVIKHSMHISKTVVEVWDIGLRPLFPLLFKMTSKLDTQEHAQIKKEWIALFSDLLFPLCSASWSTDKEFPPAFHCYILEKR